VIVIIGIVIVAHGGMAKSVKETTNLFIKKIDAFASLDLMPESGPETFVEELKRTINEVDKGEGVLVMVDLFGGTPANSVQKVISSTQNCFGITGINLGMVLEALIKRDHALSLIELMDEAKSAGIDGIRVLQPFSEDTQ